MSSAATGPAAHSAERVDPLVERVLRLAEPLRFELARSPRDLESLYRIRFQTAVHQGWIDPAQFPSGMEKDEHDDTALQIVALDGERVAGTIRMVLPAPSRRLPTEEAFSWEAEPAGGVVDVGRVCRDPHYPDPHQHVLSGLLAKVWIEMRKRGFTAFCGVASKRRISIYQRLGLRVGLYVVKAAPPRWYWGEERWAVLIRPQGAGACLDRKENYETQ